MVLAVGIRQKMELKRKDPRISHLQTRVKAGKAEADRTRDAGISVHHALSSREKKPVSPPEVQRHCLIASFPVRRDA